jgi:DUF971 family protein
MRPDDAAPAGITLDSAQARVLIDWSDGSRSSYPFRWLRSRCRCADCTAERRAAGLPASAPLSATAGVQVTAAQPQGHYAIQFTFDDGHYRGIYPWPYLREIDPQAQ